MSHVPAGRHTRQARSRAFPLSDDQPVFWIIAGPNGSGKSTAYSTASVEDTISRLWIVNPDLLTERLRLTERMTLDAANLQAVQRLEAWLEATINVHRSVGVETVLSTGKYRRLVELAKSRGFRFHIFYVVLQSPEMNIARVKARVLKGGHDVPRAKIVERYWRSLAQLPWFLEQADSAEIYDNSGASPRLVARKADGEMIIDPGTPKHLAEAIRAIEA